MGPGFLCFTLLRIYIHKLLTRSIPVYQPHIIDIIYVEGGSKTKCLFFAERVSKCEEKYRI